MVVHGLPLSSGFTRSLDTGETAPEVADHWDGYHMESAARHVAFV